MTQPNPTPQQKIQAVQAMLTAEEIDALELDADPTFRKIGEAVMAWNVLLMASGVVKKYGAAKETIAGAYVMLGTLFKYTYALGIKRGERGRALKGRKRK